MNSGAGADGYTQIEDLEDAIDQVYEKADRLDKEMKIFMNQAEQFLNYSHDPDMLRGSAEYIKENIQDEDRVKLLHQRAREEFENPEEADNWNKLLEAAEKTSDTVSQLEDTYRGLWEEFGYSDDEIDEKTEGRFPLPVFLDTWDDRPYELFRDQESYDDNDFYHEAEGSRPTMARQFEIDEEDLTSKQRADVTRGRMLNDKEERREKFGRTFEDQDFQFWRNQLSSNDPENPFSLARWVNRELMLLENTLEGTPETFAERNSE